MMKRFDIYTTTGGTYSTKPRPAVIIQALAFEDKYIDEIENALLKFIGIE
jgi:mRNA-degrading endonuclease toxin of MazEF toxin-antitoxin module